MCLDRGCFPSNLDLPFGYSGSEVNIPSEGLKTRSDSVKRYQLRYQSRCDSKVFNPNSGYAKKPCVKPRCQPSTAAVGIEQSTMALGSQRFLHPECLPRASVCQAKSAENATGNHNGGAQTGPSIIQALLPHSQWYSTLRLLILYGGNNWWPLDGAGDSTGLPASPLGSIRNRRFNQPYYPVNKLANSGHPGLLTVQHFNQHWVPGENPPRQFGPSNGYLKPLAIQAQTGINIAAFHDGEKQKLERRKEETLAPQWVSDPALSVGITIMRRAGIIQTLSVAALGSLAPYLGIAAACASYGKIAGPVRRRWVFHTRAASPSFDGAQHLWVFHSRAPRWRHHHLTCPSKISGRHSDFHVIQDLVGATPLGIQPSALRHHRYSTCQAGTTSLHSFRPSIRPVPCGVTVIRRARLEAPVVIQTQQMRRHWVFDPAPCGVTDIRRARVKNESLIMQILAGAASTGI
ncbi:hypothetical protein DFH09DRAFT_1089564 [Mycena vulgaris]|nr:hypothetical protein DFH09DRAFT_1089564 [Mycena vulgaris]